MAEKKVKKLEKKVAKLEAVKAKLMDAFKHSNEAVSNAAKVSAITRDHCKTVPLRFRFYAALSYSATYHHPYAQPHIRAHIIHLSPIPRRFPTFAPKSPASSRTSPPSSPTRPRRRWPPPRLASGSAGQALRPPLLLPPPLRRAPRAASCPSAALPTMTTTRAMRARFARSARPSGGWSRRPPTPQGAAPPSTPWLRSSRPPRAASPDSWSWPGKRSSVR